MDFNHLFEMQGMLFSIMILGAVLKRINIIPENGKTMLTDLVLYVTLPCSIIRSFQMEFNTDILMSCMTVGVIALLIQIGAYLLSLVLYPGFPETQKKVIQYATICSNAGVLGNPIAEGIFGGMGLLYASVYVIPQRIFMWSAGLTYFTEAPDKKTLVRKVLTHPCIIAVFIGLFLLFLQIPLPGFLDLTIRTVSNANTPLAMMLVGTILAGVPIRSLPTAKTVYYCFVRLILIPFLVFLCCHLTGTDPVVTGVSVVLSGMPAASTTAVMAAKYKKDEIFATKCVILSTILSMVTVPVWCIFLINF